MDDNKPKPVWGFKALAKYVLDDDSPPAVRKVRNLVDRHGLPVHGSGAYTRGFPDELDPWLRGEQIEVGTAK